MSALDSHSATPATASRSGASTSTPAVPAAAAAQASLRDPVPADLTAAIPAAGPELDITAPAAAAATTTTTAAGDGSHASAAKLKPESQPPGVEQQLTAAPAPPSGMAIDPPAAHDSALGEPPFFMSVCSDGVLICVSCFGAWDSRQHASVKF